MAVQEREQRETPTSPMFPTCLQGWQDHVMVVKAITHR